MAMRARVELKGCLSHRGNGREFKMGNPQILTNPADIKYYQGQADFTVTVMESKKSKVRAEEESEPEINDVYDEEENDENDEEEDGEDEDGEDEDEEDGEDYTEDDLNSHKKADLKNIAAEMGLDVNGTKNELIERILGNQ